MASCSKHLSLCMLYMVMSAIPKRSSYEKLCGPMLSRSSDLFKTGEVCQFNKKKWSQTKLEDPQVSLG